MKELYFIKPYKVNHKTVDNLMEGGHITLEDRRYEQLSAKPRGRSIFKKLLSMDGETRLVIYS
jgi:hypothetical protein